MNKFKRYLHGTKKKQPRIVKSSITVVHNHGIGHFDYLRLNIKFLRGVNTSITFPVKQGARVKGMKEKIKQLKFEQEIYKDKRKPKRFGSNYKLL